MMAASRTMIIPVAILPPTSHQLSVAVGGVGVGVSGIDNGISSTVKTPEGPVTSTV